MSTKADQISSIILKLVYEATRYFVPRMGVISKIDDPEGRGRILVNIPSLGWMTDEVGAWCYPIDKKSLITPAVNDWVIVQWIDGDMNLPVYSGISTQMKDMLPAAYTDENGQVLFENRAKDFSIRYDETEEVLKMGAGLESFVLGDTLDTWITGTLKALYDAHTHTGVTVGAGVTGAPAIPLTAPTGHLSDKIKGE